MRRLVASALIVACATLSSGCGLIEDATRERSATPLGALETFKGEGFRIKLPCIPAKTTDSIPVQGRAEPLRLRAWSCEDPDTAYLVGVARLPADVQFSLDGVAPGIADYGDGKVVMNKRLTYAGVPARDIRVETTDLGEPATVFVLAFVRDRSLYQVQGVVVGEHTTKPPALYRKVLKSLTFK